MSRNSPGSTQLTENALKQLPLASMPLLGYSLAFLLGVVIASLFMISPGVWIAASLFLLAVPLFASFRYLKGNRCFTRLSGLGGWIDSRLQYPFLSTNFKLRTAFFVLAIISVGAARYQSAQPQLTTTSLAWYNDHDQKWVIVGLVVEPPDVRDTYTNLRISVERIRPSGQVLHQQVTGLLLARLPAGEEFRYGDRVILRGDLITPPEDQGFSYRDYLARQGIYAYMPYARASLLASGEGNPVKSAIFGLRRTAKENLYRLFPDPEASLLAGILLGDESGISRQVQEAFTLTGAAHVIVISGFNITILAGLFMWLFVPRLGVARGALLAALLISAYTVLVGADPPVVRAAVMGGFGLLARFLGRRQAGLNSLVFSAALMVFFTPTLLWDVSFQLSFTATLGLVLFARPFEDYFLDMAAPHLPAESLKRISGMLSEYLLFTMAASLTTLPVILYHFQRLSLTSLPVNLLILPAQPALMVLAGLTLIISLIWFPIGWLASFLAWPFAAFTIRVVEWFAGIPGGSISTGEIGAIPLFLYYALLLTLAFRPPNLASQSSWLRPAFIFSFIGLMAALFWNLAAAAPDGLLHVTFLDVGGQEAILVRSPAGRYVLIGGGERISQLSDALGRRMPISDRSLDLLVVASPLEESVAALPRLIERYPPKQVLWAGSMNASYSARRLDAALTDAAIPIISAQPGQRVDLGSGVYIEVISTNRRGAVLLIVWDHFRLLLPTALGFDDLEALSFGRGLTPVTVLHLADSGYAPLNPQEWVQNLSPRLVVITVSAGHPDGLPSPETLENITGYSLLRTDQNGWIEITSDGRSIWVSSEKLTP